MIKTLVITNNHRLYEHWLHSSGRNPKECRRATKPDHIRGIRDKEVICLHGWDKTLFAQDFLLWHYLKHRVVNKEGIKFEEA